MFNYSDKVNYGPKASQSHSKKASQSHSKKALSLQKKEWWHAVIKKIKTKPKTKPKCNCHGAVQTTWWHGSQIAFKRTVQPKLGYK